MKLEEFLKLKAGTLVLGFDTVAVGSGVATLSLTGWESFDSSEESEQPSSSHRRDGVGTIWYPTRTIPDGTVVRSMENLGWDKTKTGWKKLGIPDPWTMWPGQLATFPVGETVGLITGRVVVASPDKTETPYVAARLYVELLASDGELGFVMLQTDDILKRKLFLV
jgi:hypothetical protein